MEEVRDAKWTPRGYQQDTAMTSAQPLPSIPQYTEAVLLQATGDNIRWRDDGTAPTASVGMRLLAGGEPFFYVGDVRKIRVIEEGTAAVLNCAYYG